MKSYSTDVRSKWNQKLECWIVKNSGKFGCTQVIIVCTGHILYIDMTFWHNIGNIWQFAQTTIAIHFYVDMTFYFSFDIFVRIFIYDIWHVRWEWEKSLHLICGGSYWPWDAIHIASTCNLLIFNKFTKCCFWPLFFRWGKKHKLGGDSKAGI